MKKIIMMAMATAMAMSGMAQETYEIANIATQDLNGTARYVGMGGAMDALGADISTINNNPAGVGLFRRSQAAVSFGFVSQADANETMDVSPTRMSFDQAGFVLSTNTSGRKNSFLNFAFNYSKSRNFSQILEAANSLKGSSQNMQTFGKIRSGIVETADDATFSQADYLYMNTNGTGLLNALYDTCYAATAYGMSRGTKGYIGEYDFNLSGNIQNRLFLGITFGIKDVHYEHGSCYGETLVDAAGNLLPVEMEDERIITGTGFDVKVGAIVRPIETSPFRVGLTIGSPTFYTLRSSNYTRLTAEDMGSLSIDESYRYKMNTPWNFGLSVGHTIGQNIALGLGWNYADYSYLSPRVDDGDYYDEWGDIYSQSHQDKAMKHNVKACLKGVHTLKAGVEVKPIPEFAVRLGYNYVTAMYKDNAYRDPSVWSDGVYYSSQTDFTNWKGTNRFTVGMGYTSGNFYADVAYQCQMRKGDFYPFTSGTFSWTNDEGQNVNISNTPTITEVKDTRHQLLLTLGYKF